MTRLHALVVLAIVVGACAPGRGRQPVEEPPQVSGFLDDYSLLQPGGPGELQLVYRNPTADWHAYDKVLLDPVTLWRSGRKSLDPVPEADLLRLISHFQIAIRNNLAKGFTIVDKPGPGVMKIRLGITDARATHPVVDVLSAQGSRVGGASSKGGTLDPEMRQFLQRASIEGEIRDAVTGKLLAEGVDHRRSDAKPFESWVEVERALDSWASRLVARLEARTGRS